MISKIKSWLFKKITRSNFFKSSYNDDAKKSKENAKKSFEVVAEANNTTLEAMLQTAKTAALNKQKQADIHLIKSKEITASAGKKYADDLFKIISIRDASYSLANKEKEIGKGLEEEAATELQLIENLI